MFKKFFLLCLAMFSLIGCSSNELKHNGGKMAVNPLGMVIGLPIYGIGMIVESQENEAKAKEEAEKAKTNTTLVGQKTIEENDKVIQDDNIKEEIKNIEKKDGVN